MAASDSLPAGYPLPGSSPVIGAPCSGTNPQAPDRGGPPQFPPSPSTRSTPSTPGGSSGLRLQALHPFHGLRPDGRGSAPPCSHHAVGMFTTRQTSLHAADRVVAPPQGLSTSGSGPARFQTRPPICYRPPGSYPDRTFTGRRRRACLQTDQIILHRPSTSGRTPALIEGGQVNGATREAAAVAAASLCVSYVYAPSCCLSVGAQTARLTVRQRRGCGTAASPERSP